MINDDDAFDVKASRITAFGICKNRNLQSVSNQSMNFVYLVTSNSINNFLCVISKAKHVSLPPRPSFISLRQSWSPFSTLPTQITRQNCSNTMFFLSLNYR